MKCRYVRQTLWAGTAAAVAMFAAAANGASMTHTFDQSLSNNSSGNASVGGQFSVTVADLGYTSKGVNQVSFLFQNAGSGVESSIARVYFEDGALLGSSQIHNGPGVDFTSPYNPGPSPGPPNVPAGNDAPNNPFSATQRFVAKPSPNQNGIQPGEFLEIQFNLKDGKSYSDVIAAIENGFNGNSKGEDTLRMAMHVIGFADGGSESFIVVPLPAPFAMALLGLAGVVGFRSRHYFSS